MANKSELIREFIRELFGQNHDFSNRELNKQKFAEHFESEANKPLQISWKEHQTLFVDQFKIVCKEKNVEPSTYGYAKEKKSFVKKGTDTQWNTQPKPKEIAQQNNQAMQATNNQQAQQNQQLPEKITPLTDEESFKLCRIIAKTCGNMAHAAKEKFEAFSDEESDELGAALNPILKPYLERHGGKWFTLLFVGGSIVAKRAEAFKKDTKDKKDSEKEPEKKPEPTKDELDAFEKWKKEHS